MKNYRASLLYSGSVGLANAEDYYNNDKAGKAKLTVATDMGITMADLSAGSDGQYADKDGNKAYFGWSGAINNDWMQGAALTDYADYMTEDVYNSLDALANEDGYIPMTDKSIKLLHSFTGSADWGNESEENLINYAYREDGITEETPWENVGFIKNDDYTFTLVLKNPTSLFNFESEIDNVTLVKKDLYEANKQETGGIYKSSYGTAVDKFSSYGSYKITSYQESKEVKFEKNENWYDYKDGKHEGQYQTTNILWQQIDEHTTQLSMFLQGNLDIVGLASDDMEKYGTSDYVYYTPESYTYYLALNTDFNMLKSREAEGVNKTILTYVDFRKAMSFAIDRNDYVKSCTANLIDLELTRQNLIKNLTDLLDSYQAELADTRKKDYSSLAASMLEYLEKKQKESVETVSKQEAYDKAIQIMTDVGIKEPEKAFAKESGRGFFLWM